MGSSLEVSALEGLSPSVCSLSSVVPLEVSSSNPPPEQPAKRANAAAPANRGFNLRDANHLFGTTDKVMRLPFSTGQEVTGTRVDPVEHDLLACLVVTLPSIKVL